MDIPAVCDSVPEPLARGEVPGGVLPSHEASFEGASVVLGVVTEARSGRALPSALVALHRADSEAGQVRVGREIPTDAVGRFVFGPVPPGAYTLRVRAMRHWIDERSLLLRASAIDTVRVQMRYFRCVGY